MWLSDLDNEDVEPITGNYNCFVESVCVASRKRGLVVRVVDLRPRGRGFEAC